MRRQVNNKKIAILGFAFKADTGSLSVSLSLSAFPSPLPLSPLSILGFAF
jgi:hypothetical protein